MRLPIGKRTDLISQHVKGSHLDLKTPEEQRSEYPCPETHCTFVGKKEKHLKIHFARVHRYQRVGLGQSLARDGEAAAGNPEEKAGEDAIGLSGGDKQSGSTKLVDESAGISLNFFVSFAYQVYAFSLYSIPTSLVRSSYRSKIGRGGDVLGIS